MSSIILNLIILSVGVLTKDIYLVSVAVVYTLLDILYELRKLNKK